MTIIPAIDLQGGKCVRLVRGELGTETVFSEDPVEMALAWQEQGATLLHVVDLDAAFGAKRRNRSSISRIVDAVKVPVQVGGGVRRFSDFEGLRDVGAAWVVFGTAAANDPAVVQQALRADAESVVIGVDVKGGKVAVEGWQEESEHDPIAFGKRWVGEGAITFVYTDVSRDGVMTGPNVEAVRQFGKETGARVIASGGIGSLDDLRSLRVAESDGVEAAIVGRALYERKFTLTDAVEAVRAES